MIGNNADLHKFWDELKLNSDSFQTPILKKNLFNTNELFNEEEFLNIFKDLSSYSEDFNKASCRVFVDDGINFKATNRLMKNPPRKDEELESWFGRIFGQRKFGIVINKAEKYNSKLASKIASFIEPLTKNYESNEFEAEIVCFFGNYGWTPFGIHYDDYNMNVLHFHFGPGEKKMFVWNRKALIKKMGCQDRNYYPTEPIESIAKYGKTFTLTKGDLFLLPANQYHIGQSNDFSIGITVVLQRKSRKELLKRSLILIEKQLVRHISTDITKDVFLPEKLESLLDNKNIRNELGNPNLLTETLNELELRGKSNSYLSEIPLLRKSVPSSFKGQKVKLIQPFKMIVKNSNEVINIYVRGRKVMLIKDCSILVLMKKLNNDKPVDVDKIILENESGLSEEMLLDIISRLYEYGGIEKVKGVIK